MLNAGRTAAAAVVAVVSAAVVAAARLRRLPRVRVAAVVVVRDHVPGVAAEMVLASAAAAVVRGLVADHGPFVVTVREMADRDEPIVVRAVAMAVGREFGIAAGATLDRPAVGITTVRAQVSGPATSAVTDVISFGAGCRSGSTAGTTTAIATGSIVAPLRRAAPIGGIAMSRAGTGIGETPVPDGHQS